MFKSHTYLYLHISLRGSSYQNMCIACKCTLYLLWEIIYGWFSLYRGGSIGWFFAYGVRMKISEFSTIHAKLKITNNGGVTLDIGWVNPCHMLFCENMRIITSKWYTGRWTFLTLSQSMVSLHSYNYVYPNYFKTCTPSSLF